MTLPSQQLISIIVPVYNEARTVAAVIQRLLTIDLPAPREIIVVNDGSTDGTRTVLDGLPANPSVMILHSEKNMGKGYSVRRGIARTRGTVIAIQDADLELDPAQLADLVTPVIAGDAVVIYGSRFMHGQTGAPFMTLAGNRLLTTLTNILYRASLTDMETCYKVMRGDIARGLTLSANRFDIEPEITARLLGSGHTIVERPVKFEPRSKAAGKKMRWRDGWMAIRVLLSRRFGR